MRGNDLGTLQALTVPSPMLLCSHSNSIRVKSKSNSHSSGNPMGIRFP